MKATDNVGNESTDSATVRVDTIAPNVTITPNDTLWRAGVVQVTVAVSDPGVGASGVASVCVTTTGGCVELEPGANGEYATTLTVPSGTDGAPTISATVTDVAGNSKVVGPVAIKIDRKAPVLTFGSNQVGAWTNTAVTVTASATDGTGSGLERLCLDDTCNATSPKTETVNPALGSVSERTFTASATDNVGNTTTASPVTVRVDRAIPTATIAVSGTGGVRPVNSNVTVTFSCGDIGSGISTCELFDRGIRLSSNPTQPVALNTSQPGTSSLTVRATDSAGNVFTTAPVTVVVGYNVCLDYNPNAAKKAGAAYGITIRLCDGNNNTVQADGITLTALTIDGTPIVDASAPGGSNPTYTFSYSASTAQFSYNLKTDRPVEGPSHSSTSPPFPYRTGTSRRVNCRRWRRTLCRSRSSDVLDQTR